MNIPNGQVDPPPAASSDTVPHRDAPPGVPRACVRRLSWRKKWAFRILAMSFPLAVLTVAELILNWMGVAKDLRLIQPVGKGAPSGMVRFNPDTDQTYFSATNLGGPEPRPFMLPKPAGTFRIVVVGGSTVFGF